MLFSGLILENNVKLVKLFAKTKLPLWSGKARVKVKGINGVHLLLVGL